MFVVEYKESIVHLLTKPLPWLTGEKRTGNQKQPEIRSGMSELSIKIRIADRDYPMRVNEEEEERLRAAGRLLNERMKAFREQFGTADKQDLLAMVALETLADKLLTAQNKAESENTLADKLTHLNKLLASLKLE